MMAKNALSGTMKRYHLVLPQDLFDAVEKEAEARSTTTVELLRKFIRLGILASQPNVQIILREPDKESVIVLL